MRARKHFAGMHEQSHKDEMRNALRGDFERLRARRGDAAVSALAPEPVEVVPEPASGPIAASVATTEPRAAERRGFGLGRLLRRG
jgi:hypothetical protein